MVVMPDTEYVTIRRGRGGMVDVFVGGEPATRYCGKIIYDIDYVKSKFAWMQGKNPNIVEFHILSSETSGYFATVGNPSFTHGLNAWCRVKNGKGQLSGWFFCRPYVSATDCAYACARSCVLIFLGYVPFQRAVLGTFDNGQNGKNAQSDDLGCIDWSQKLGVHNVGLYEIFVREITQNTK